MSENGNGEKIMENILLKYKNIELFNQLHPTRNEGIDVDALTYGSGKKVWWMCDKGHEWQAAIRDREFKRNGCPYCSSRRVLSGFNDLKTKYPKLAKQWHPIKNNDLKASDVMPKSNKKVWWLCEKGHEWQTTPNSRTTGGYGCPYCSGFFAIQGETDLQTKAPELAKQWHPTKNGDLKPSQVTCNYSKKVWWMCDKGHEWQATVHNRYRGKTGCPKCWGITQTSFSEQAVFYYMNKYYPDSINGDKSIIGKELDIYIPSKKVAIEYDGRAWHNTNISLEKDKKKNKLCIEANIQLIRIREPKLPTLTGCVVFERSDFDSYSSLNDVINSILKYLGVYNADVDVYRDMILINEQYKFQDFKNSLLSKNPELAKQWHPTKNGDLKPSDISYGSGKKVWWMCDIGHEWQAAINSRSQGVGCPFCAGRLAISGKTDLQTKNPELAKQWHPIKNGNLKPSNITPNSDKKVWWICNKGHEWHASISSRSRGNGCPYCAGQRVISGENDLQTKYPELAKQWHPTKNGDLKPTDVTYGSGKSIWWICDKGHEWQSKICNRAKGNGCPYCAGNIRKRIFCVETNIIYNGLSEASIATKIASSAISNCCNGKRQTAGGYHWKYVDNNKYKEFIDNGNQPI